jgi:hypothetical protein
MIFFRPLKTGFMRSFEFDAWLQGQAHVSNEFPAMLQRGAASMTSVTPAVVLLCTISAHNKGDT